MFNALQGGGQQVLGQELPAWGPSSTATVEVFNPILSNDIYSPTVSDAQHTTSVSIHTELVYREVFITEVVYNTGDYANFVYPFGRKMEITTTNALSNFSLNNYSLIFYRVCDATHYVQNIYPLANLHCYLSPTNLTNITTVNAQTAFIVDLPSLVELNTTATPLTYCANNSQQLIIALVKNPIGATNIKLLNLIGANISDDIGVNTNGNIAINSFDANTYKPVKIVSNPVLLDNSIYPTSWYLDVNNWKYYPNNTTPLGVLNNVISCNYYIPKYYFTDLPRTNS